MENLNQYRPRFAVPNGKKADEYLRMLVFEGLTERYGKHLEREIASEQEKEHIRSNEILQRAEEELIAVFSKDYADYILIWHDIIDYAKKRDIAVGTAHGTSGGSVVCYALGLTDIDPFAYGLLFERFINHERGGFLDIEIDVDVTRREEVCEYIKQKYGEDYVCKVSIYGTLKPRAAIMEAGLTIKMPYEEVSEICDLLPKYDRGQRLKDYLGKESDNTSYTLEKLKNLYETDQDIKRLLDIALTIEGKRRRGKRDESAVCISNELMCFSVPLLDTGNEPWLVTEYNKHECKSEGLMCLDIIGHKTLGVIQKVAAEVRKRNLNFTVKSINYFDKEVFHYLSGAYGKDGLSGVFQFESKGIQKLLSQIKPDRMEDLFSAIAIYRPGLMELVPMFIQGKKNPSDIRYIDQCLKPILEETYGIILYQEQVMKILHEMGGFTMEKADIARSHIANRNSQEIKKLRGLFIEGATGKFILGEHAAKVFDELISLTPFTICKAHAAASATLSYQTAYLSYYFPMEYYTVCLELYGSCSKENKRYREMLNKIKNKEIKDDICNE